MTALVDTITLLYSMQESDIDALSDRLLAQRAIEWTQSIQQELRRYGCNQAALAPVGGDALELFSMSQKDAAGIANTYNRELRNQVQRLYNANPKGNRNYYFKGLEAWAGRRDAYKAQQIALNTSITTGEYARRRFREENNVEGNKWTFSGPPPVCEKCIRLKAMGIVGIEIVNQYGDSQHVNCPHYWTPLRVRGIVDCSTVWAGG